MAARQDTIDLVKARFEAAAIERERDRAYAEAQEPKVKQAVLDVPATFQDTAASILKRAQAQVSFQWWQEKEAREKERDEKDWLEEHPYPVKEALDAIRANSKVIEMLLRQGRISPEAIGFTSRKVDNLINLLGTLKENLEVAKAALEGVK